MNNDDRALLLAICMGDGSVRGNNLQMTHGQKQRAYLEWKTCVINRILGTSSVCREINNSGYVGYYVHFSSEKLAWFSEFLRDNNWRPEAAAMLTPQALAVTWMDDGCLAVKMRNGRKHGMEGFISTYTDKPRNDAFVKALNDKFGLSFTSVKDRKAYRCRTGLSGLRVLQTLILPYVHSDLFYKIDLSRQ